ncbi:hypothetical protein GN156_08125 [bacterium LRH843]|nr:hypothetical protein [bacterium LRH843]
MIFVMLIFVLTIGVTLGGLLVAPRDPIRPLHLLLPALLFLFVCYVGMIVGMFFTGWVSIRILEFLLCIIALVFIVACISRYHPTFGFFHPRDPMLIGLLATLFFLIGLEWGLLEFRTFFTITATVLFTGALIAGILIQLHIRELLWRHSYIPFAPLFWLLFITVCKLL